MRKTESKGSRRSADRRTGMRTLVMALIWETKGEVVEVMDTRVCDDGGFLVASTARVNSVLEPLKFV